MVADLFRLRYKLTPDHFQSYLKLAAKRSRSSNPAGRFLRAIIFGLLTGLILLALDRSGYLSSREVSIFFLGAGIAALAIGILSIIANKKMVSNIVGSHDAMTGEFTLAAYEGGGIQITGKHLQSSFDWTAFLDLTQSSDILVLWIDKGAGTIIPHAAFADENERQQFADFVNDRIKTYKTTD